MGVATKTSLPHAYLMNAARKALDSVPPTVFDVRVGKVVYMGVYGACAQALKSKASAQVVVEVSPRKRAW